MPARTKRIPPGWLVYLALFAFAVGWVVYALLTYPQTALKRKIGLDTPRPRIKDALTLIKPNDTLVFTRLTVENPANETIKDVEVACKMIAPSGTELGELRNTLFVTVGPRGTFEIPEPWESERSTRRRTMSNAAPQGRSSRIDRRQGCAVRPFHGAGSDCAAVFPF